MTDAAMREVLGCVTDILEVWASDHPEERTADIDGAIYCARKIISAPLEDTYVIRGFDKSRDPIVVALGSNADFLEFAAEFKRDGGDIVSVEQFPVRSLAAARSAMKEACND